MKELVTFKFYNDKKQRQSLFGREINGKLEIFKLTCSRKDSFFRGLSRVVYENYKDGTPTIGYHPEIILLDIE